jgi:hypothetical protein
MMRSALGRKSCPFDDRPSRRRVIDQPAVKESSDGIGFP